MRYSIQQCFSNFNAHMEHPGIRQNKVSDLVSLGQCRRLLISGKLPVTPRSPGSITPATMLGTKVVQPGYLSPPICVCYLPHWPRCPCHLCWIGLHRTSIKQMPTERAFTTYYFYGYTHNYIFIQINFQQKKVFVENWKKMESSQPL